MDISRILNSHIPGGTETIQIGSSEDSSPGFAALLEKSLGDVNELLTRSDGAAKELAVGKTENLHEAMIGFEKAETALKLLMQVRNKALEAYNQILQMQI